MLGAGKRIRWSRFVDAETGHGIIVPLDHGLTLGPIDGIASVENIARWINHPTIHGIIAHKGMVERLSEAGLLTRIGVMIHLNGMAAIGEVPDTKHLLTSMETAVRLGADAVSIQVNFLPDNYVHNLTLLGTVVDEAQKYGLPVLAMVYDKGSARDARERLHRFRHLIRIALELGIDAVKTSPPEDLSTIPDLIEGIGRDIALFFSGGSLTTDQNVLVLAQAIAKHKVTGICIGRNVFQRPDPSELLCRIHECIFA